MTYALSWMINLSMNIKFEIIWKKQLWPDLGKCPQNVLKHWITRTFTQSYILEAHLCKHLGSYITTYLFCRMAASKCKTKYYTEIIVLLT